MAFTAHSDRGERRGDFLRLVISLFHTILLLFSDSQSFSLSLLVNSVDQYLSEFIMSKV